LYLVETEMLLQAKVIPSSTYQHMVPYTVRIFLEGKTTWNLHRKSPKEYYFPAACLAIG
jgi:hypothetical protein